MPTLDVPLRHAIAMGLLAGVMAGLLGVGGGIVLVPGLVLLLGVPQKEAHATSLAAIMVTAPAAVLPFAREGAVSWEAAFVLAAGAQVGVLLGTRVMHRIPPDRLRRLFGGFMVLIALRFALPGGAATSVDAAAMDSSALALLAACGLLTGVLSSVLGVGGGVILVPAMVLVIGFGQHLAEGTSLAVIIPTALVGALRHQRNGYTNWPLGLTIGAGGLVGGVAGGTLAQRLPADLLQAAFAVLLVVSGLRLLRRDRVNTPQ